MHPTAHQFHEFGLHGKHLYHATEPPKIVHNAEDEAKARGEGYGDEYIPHEYPKFLVTGEDKDGNPIGRVVHSAD